MMVNGNFVNRLHDELLCSKCVGGPLREMQQHESSEFEGRKRWSKQRSERSQSLFVRHDRRCVSCQGFGREEDLRIRYRRILYMRRTVSYEERIIGRI